MRRAIITDVVVQGNMWEPKYFSREPKEPFFGRGHLLIRVLWWEDGQGTEVTDFVGQGNQWEPEFFSWEPMEPLFWQENTC